ncbi:MAG: galactose oxidase-like domain-containing protein [Planctomycetota bacterium]
MNPTATPVVHPASASLPGPLQQYWITENFVNATGAPASVPGQRFQAIHTNLIPSGPYRGCLLVWDGTLTQVGTRSYQPWAVVNPYGANGNPFVPGGGSAYTFHNAVLQMDPTQTGPQQTLAGVGELFCADERWTADGRLFVAGGTRAYPPIPGTGLPLFNSTVNFAWEGARVVYQWDPMPSPNNPFGTWWKMLLDMQAERWYPTVTSDGSLENRFLILGGTDILPGTTTFAEINTYESCRISFGSNPPVLLAFEQKLGSPPPPPTARQYEGPFVTIPPFLPPFAGLTEYPRIHPVGVLDPITSGTTNRLFVSGYMGQGITWAHDPATNPAYSLDIGQEAVPSRVIYSTNLLLPTGVGAVANRVVRIGGERISTLAPGYTNRVESVVVTIPVGATNRWSSGTDVDIPDMIHARYFANVVILPTGDLFAVGGRPIAGSFNFEPELYSVASGLWRPMAMHTSSPRDYHSCALLLPDGRVLVCGGENRTTDYQIWIPPYLLGPANRRPVGVGLVDSFSSAPISQDNLLGATYGQHCRVSWSNTLPAGVEVAQVVLMAPAAVTHHCDGGQRCVRLASLYTEDAIPGSLHILMPATHRHAPPGWYMLFVITNEGVPANAFWVNLG